MGAALLIVFPLVFLGACGLGIAFLLRTMPSDRARQGPYWVFIVLTALAALGMLALVVWVLLGSRGILRG